MSLDAFYLRDDTNIIYLYSGTDRSESITIPNTKGRLSQEDIEHTPQEAEAFATEDQAQQKHIEVLNGLRGEIGDLEVFGGKTKASTMKTLLATIKGPTDWIDENGQTASTEALEDNLQ